MHARILRYLDEVVRTGSIRKAAARLGVASSSISRQITDLEGELGSPVFERMPGKMRLTAAGEMLISHIRQTLKDHERLMARIGQMQHPGGGLVRLATQNGPISGLVPRLALDFSERFPAVRFSINALTGPALMAAIKSGEADIGLGYNLPNDARVKVLHRVEARLGAVMHPSHPLARKASLRLAECAQYPIILADASLSLRQVIDDAALRIRTVLHSTVDTNSTDLMKGFLDDGESLTFLSEPDVLDDVRAGRLIYLPLLDKSLTVQTLSLVQRENAVPDFSAALFAEEIMRAMTSLPGRAARE
ncbi:LysR family transcriptional regulator [Devosia chinhatensis]|uniref:HTH lysR-type domain-containing protein n=1 Tax=Devosia chinhatensis TaxID=429727 RepID=A0A0F5FMH6_9HYPH|nr:LysR family transcriptional regulator [Devosia chinhatensis]KKB10074.1 hypothetical protein VE26_09855 [Devosia chinhatensis]